MSDRLPRLTTSVASTVLDGSIMQAIHIEALEAVHGGARTGQQDLRAMAKKWCPQTYAKNASAPQLTRRMGEQCLDEGPAEPPVATGDEDGATGDQHACSSSGPTRSHPATRPQRTYQNILHFC